MTQKELAIKEEEERAILPVGKSLLENFFDKKLYRHESLRDFLARKKKTKKARKVAKASKRRNRA